MFLYYQNYAIKGRVLNQPFTRRPITIIFEGESAVKLKKIWLRALFQLIPVMCLCSYATMRLKMQETDRQVKLLQTRGLKESGWHLALFSTGANSVGRTDVSRLASDAQRFDKIKPECALDVLYTVFIFTTKVSLCWHVWNGTKLASCHSAEALGDSAMWG